MVTQEPASGMSNRLSRIIKVYFWDLESPKNVDLGRNYEDNVKSKGGHLILSNYPE